MEGLTTVFGMGTGVAPPVLPPEAFFQSATNNNIVALKMQILIEKICICKILVEVNGIESMTPCLQSRCSPS